jgi:RNA polymerase sigma-70 factor (ECF subfamily)
LEAFDELVSAHQARVYALAYRIMGNPEDASDVQQETFVRAWRSLGKFRKDAEFSTWLHRITVNLCISMKRRKDYQSTEPLCEDRLSASVDSGGIACLEKTDVATTVRKVMAALPAHYRALLVLREVEGRCFEEVARILGCSEQSARSRACKARKLLRERIRPYLEEEMQ